MIHFTRTGENEEELLRRLGDRELQRRLKRYRLITLPPLISGLFVTILLIWLGPSAIPWGLLYFLLIIALLPSILRSGRLHREWRRRRKLRETSFSRG